MPDGPDGHPRPDERTAAEIREGLGRILASEVFRAAPQLSAFLSFIVERAVEGRGGELKGYTIAVEALGRSPEFDPQTDPIVRVEAGRLRKALTQYYAAEGRSDPLRITVPVGAYVPIFLQAAERGAPEPAEPRPVATQPRRAGWSTHGLRLAALALACAVLGWLLWVFVLADPASDRATPIAPAALPVVAIVMSQMPPDSGLADRLRRASSALVDAMSRFDDLLVVKAPAEGAPLPDGTDYVLDLSLRRLDGMLEGFGQLRSAKDGRVIWVSSISRPIGETVSDNDLPGRMQRIAARLAEPFGVIHADGRQNPASPAAACIYEALDYQRFMTGERHAPAVDCLRQMAAKDPSFYPARAHLAGLLLAEYASGRGNEPRHLLDEAMSAALTAQRLAPFGARAQQAVMDALFLRGATADALAAGQEALSRNPNDPQILADLGAVYVRLDRSAEGLPLLERAIELSPGRPAWYNFYAYLAAYLLADSRKTQTHFAFMPTDSSPLGLLAQALEAKREGEVARREELMRRLALAVPLFGRNPRAFLERKGFSAPLITRILADLGDPGH